MASKIVVIGGVEGRFQEVFPKLAALHAKNAFALAIIAGDLFRNPLEDASDADEDLNKLLNGKIAVTLPTYFALGNSPLPQQVIDKLEQNNDEICENLYFLGRRTTIKTSEGIKVVALGGVHNSEVAVAESKGKYAPFYSTGDANSLRGANTADVLITSEWPASIRKGSKIESRRADEETRASQQCVAELCATLKPRYHFTTSSTLFFEREPFFHPPVESNPEGYAITRFISLANFGNADKQKWIYAFSLDPTASAPVVIPPGTTASPLSFINKKRPSPAEPQAFSRYSQDTRHHDRPRKKQRQPPPGPSECFFCLSNPNLAAHLVTSIGTDAYLTTAKGPLSTSETFPSLGFPSHILIIPLAHSPTLSSIPDPDSRTSTLQEMQRYRHALNRMLQSNPKTTAPEGDTALGSVTWEVSRSSGIHTHWQFLPCPASLIQRGLVAAAFKVEAENESYPAFEAPDGSPADNEAGDAFNVWIWDPSPGAEDGASQEGGDTDGGAGGRETALRLRLDPSFRFDLQFGRRVLAKLLGLEDRTGWRDCAQTEQEEARDAEAFKAAFAPFDFSLEE